MCYKQQPTAEKYNIQLKINYIYATLKQKLDKIKEAWSSSIDAPSKIQRDIQCVCKSLTKSTLA